MAVQPEHPGAQQLQALAALLAAGKPSQAADDAAAMIRSFPDSALAWQAHGAALQAAGRGANALAAMQRAAALAPGEPQTHFNLGVLLTDAQRLTEAEAAYRRALTLKPDFVQAQFNLARLLHAGRRLPLAEAAWRRVIELQPGNAAAHHHLGLLLHETGRLQAAAAAYQRAIALDARVAQFHHDFGTLLQHAGQSAAAEEAYRRTIAIAPGHADAHNNLGALLQHSGRLTEAEAAYRRAVELRPAHDKAHGNLGTLLQQAGHLVEAEAAYRAALALTPDDAALRMNFGMLLLRLQRHAEGWPYYESRVRASPERLEERLAQLPFPPWRGEDLAGKSLALWSEQGFGDALQFSRYVPLLKARGVAQLSLVCEPELEALFHTLQGVDTLITDVTAVPVHDYWALTTSLPLYYGIGADFPPAALPYLAAPASRIAHWRERLQLPGFKVGLVWQGGAEHSNDAQRSLPGLAALAPLWAVAGVSFVSLQTGPGAAQADSPPAGQPMHVLGGELRDFADTAAVLGQLDLLICVDTAIAHLAGALGRPCWVLLSAYDTDWRWSTEGTQTPWYPGVMRLFRQGRIGQWDETVAEVARALGEAATPAKPGARTVKSRKSGKGRA